MIWLTLAYKFIRQLWAKVLTNPSIAIIILIGIVLLLILLKPSKKPDIKIYDPRTEINSVQQESDDRIGDTFNAIDRQRELDDNRIREAQKSPTPVTNINAKDLEEKLRGRR